MNVADTAVIRSLLHDAGYMEAEKIGDAEIVLINTCAIRDNVRRA
jgi:tRNA A37 methylthiotransferase MiaB